MVIILTDKGKIRGIQKSNYQCFLGIPYAKPPINDLRLQEPQIMDYWDDIKNTTKYGPIAPQNHKDLVPIEQVENEDCLYLNIWTPKADNKTRPVMFWIHGGGYLTGAGSRPRFNGSRLSVYGNVVVVTFNYRLGAFGFLDLPGVSPNIGIQDQIAALKWVQENIQSFGGDPNNITIFGESAGSESIVILLITPLVKGLFHRAIMQSGVANPISFIGDYTRTGAEEFLTKLRIDTHDIDSLREVPLDKFMRIQKKIAGVLVDAKINPFRPFIDGKIIPDQPIDIICKGNARNVPLILGSNQDELGIIINYLNQVDDERKKVILEIIQKRINNQGVDKEGLDILIDTYKPIMERKYPDRPYKFWEGILSDSMFRIPIIRQLEAHIKHQSNVYCYIFTYESSKYGGAFHTYEIPFVFGTLGKGDMPDGAFDSMEEAKLVARNIMRTWVTFAYTGNPNHDEIPEWLPYDNQKRATMMLGVKPKLEYDPSKPLRDVWKNIS
jgi:para-nitrobenzyl esterase